MALPAEVVAAVSALAAAPMEGVISQPGTRSVLRGSSEIDQLGKGARKKEKFYCYRCGGGGHYAVDCTAELCDYCLKAGHPSDECPLLLAPKPVVTAYGVCDDRLLFFETQSANSSRPRVESARTGIVKVTGGSLSEEQVIQQLRRLVPADFRWILVRIEDNVFKVDFPR